jgi:hypothetical protein
LPIILRFHTAMLTENTDISIAIHCPLLSAFPIREKQCFACAYLNFNLDGMKTYKYVYV